MQLSVCKVSLSLLFGGTLGLCRCSQRPVDDREVAMFMTGNDVFYYQPDFALLTEVGVTEYIFLGGRVQSDGSFSLNRELNASYVQSVIEQVGDFPTVLLGVGIFEFLDGNGNLTEFERNAQKTIHEYNVHGLLFETSYWGRDLQGDEWRALNEIMTVTRSLRGRGRDAAIASFKFTAGNTMTSTIWEDITTYKPWLYSDYAYANLRSKNVDPEMEVSLQWARMVADRYDEMSHRRCELSLVVSCFARNKVSDFLRTFRSIVKQGGDPMWNGSSKGYYSNTQSLIRSKADLIKKTNLLGMGLADIYGDLPLSSSSLAWSMLEAFHH